jgi:teichuronic acid exporter
MSIENHVQLPISTTRLVLRALRWNVALRTTAQMVTWLSTIFVMRLLNPADYGLMGLAAILLGFFGLINELGAIPALIQLRQVDERLIRKIFSLVLISNSTLYVAALAVAPAFAAFFGQPDLIVVVRVLALGLLIGAFSAIPSVLLQRDLEFKFISLIELGATLVGSLTALMLASHRWGVWALVCGSLAREVCNAIGLMAITRFRVRPLFNFTGLRAVLTFGIKISGARIVWYFNNSVDGLLISKILGDRALGLYSVANNLATLPITKALGLSNQIAFAAYSRFQNDRERAREYFLETTRIASLFLFPLCWGMSAIADDFVDLVLGSSWHGAAIVLQIVALGAPYRALGLFMQPLVDGLGEPGIGLKNTMTLTFIVPGAAVMGLFWGLVGLCVASVAGLVVGVTINLRRNLTLLNAGYQQLLFAFLPSMLTAAVMYAAVLAAKQPLAHEMSAVWRLATIVAVGAVTYGGLTLCFNRRPAMRCLQLIRGAI